MVEASAIFMLIREAMWIALFTTLPVLGAVLLSALFTGILQSVTKLSEATLAVVPRIIAGMITLIALGPWIGGRIASFAERTWALLQSVQI